MIADDQDPLQKTEGKVENTKVGPISKRTGSIGGTREKNTTPWSKTEAGSKYFQTINMTSPSFRLEGYSKWNNQCTYKCQLCDEEFKSRGRLVRHLTNNHQMSNMEHTKLFRKSVCHEVRKKCPMEGCSSLIMFHERALHKHIHTHHNISVRECYIRCVLKEEPMVKSTNCSDSKLPFITHTCHVCAIDLESMTSFLTHIPEHNITYPEYLQKYSTSTEVNTYQCLFCQKVLPLDEKGIWKHLQEMHIYAYQTCTKNNPPSATLQEDNDITATVSNSMRYAPQFKWDKCVRHCHVCGKDFSTYKTYANHLKHDHDRSIVNAPEKVEGDIYEEHACLICKSMIKFEYVAMCVHLKRVHQYSMHMYEKEFFVTLKEVFESMKQAPLKAVYQSIFDWNQCPKYLSLIHI